jgi:hypothetical protein
VPGSRAGCSLRGGPTRLSLTPVLASRSVGRRRSHVGPHRTSRAGGRPTGTEGSSGILTPPTSPSANPRGGCTNEPYREVAEESREGAPKVPGEADVDPRSWFCLVEMSGRAVCPALGTGGRWTPWHAERPPGAGGGANEAGPMHQLADHGSAQEPGWLVERLRLGVGHASTVRPDPSTPGVVGERGSRHEGRSPARPRQRVSRRSCDADGGRQVEEILPLPLGRPLVCDLAQHADKLSTLGRSYHCGRQMV